jgi:hypothetical protein
MIARQPSADPPMVGRKRNSSSAEDSTRRSKRTRRFSNVPQSTTSKSLVPRDRFGVDVEGILERAGLTPLVLTRAEASRAEEMPGIERTAFINAFGGTTKNSEWQQCSKAPGYEDFFCASITAQPFMPLVPGKPGLLLRLPVVIEMPQSDRDKCTFHVLSATELNGALHYLGKYTRIPLPQIQFTWANLPIRVRS